MGRWDQLHSYSSGGTFSITIDSNLTVKQTDARNLMTTFVEEADQLKTEQLDVMLKMEQKLKELEETLPFKKEAEMVAQRNVDDAKTKHEASWYKFAMQHPVEYSEIKLFYDVNTSVGKVAQWMFADDPKFAQLKMWMKKLEGLSKLTDFHPEILLPVIKQIEAQLTDQNKSSIALLKNLGSADLRRQMRPVCRDYESAAKSLDDSHKVQ